MTSYSFQVTRFFQGRVAALITSNLKLLFYLTNCISLLTACFLIVTGITLLFGTISGNK